MDSNGDTLIQSVPVNVNKSNAAASEKQKIVILDRNRNSSGGVMIPSTKAITMTSEKNSSPSSSINNTSSSNNTPSSSPSIGSPTFNFVHPLNGNLLDRNRNLSIIEDLESYLFECSTCNVKQDVSTIFLHAKNVHGVFICLYCLQFYKFAKELMVHLHREHRGPSQRYSSGVEFLQHGGNSTILLCVECNKIFLSESVDSVKTHAHECRKSTGICPKCGTILLLSLLGGHIAACKGSMNLILEGNNVSAAQLRNRDNCKFCSKKFSPSKILAHVRSCSARIGRSNKPIENGAPHDGDGFIGFGHEHKIPPIRKRPLFPPLPQLFKGERGFAPVVVSKKNKVMPELNPVLPTGPTPTTTLNSSTSIATTNSVSKGLSSGEKVNSTQPSQSPASQISNEDASKPNDVEVAKPQKSQSVIVTKLKPERRTALPHYFSKPAGASEKPPVSLASISSLSSSITLTPVMTKFMNGDLEENDDHVDDTTSGIKEEVVHNKSDSTTTITKRIIRGGAEPSISLDDEPHRPRRSLKKITREDFMYETVSKRSYQRSHSISSGSMSAAGSPMNQHLGSNRSPDIGEGGVSARPRNSVSVSEITINKKSFGTSSNLDVKNESGVVMFDYDHEDGNTMENRRKLVPSGGGVQPKRQIVPQNKRKLGVSQPSNVLTSVVNYNSNNYNNEYYDESESDPEPEIKLDPLLIEQDTFKRLGLLIVELCEKLSPQFSTSVEPSDTSESSGQYELLVNYSLSEKSSDNILTDMLHKTSVECLYCRQVKLIRVDKRQLVMHLLTIHSWKLRCLRTPEMLLKSLKASGEKLASENSSNGEPIKKEEEEEAENKANPSLNVSSDTTEGEPLTKENVDPTPLGIENSSKSADKTDDTDYVSIDKQSSSENVSGLKSPSNNSLSKPKGPSDTYTVLATDTNTNVESTTESNIKECNASCDTKAIVGEDLGTADCVKKCEKDVAKSAVEDKTEGDAIVCTKDDKPIEATNVVDDANTTENIALTVANIKHEDMQSTSNQVEDLSNETDDEMIHIGWKDFKLALLDKIFRSENIVFAYKDSSLEPFGEIPCECLLCGFMADSQITLFPHWRKVHRGVAMKCAMCQGKFLFAGALFSHLCLGTPSPVIRDTTTDKSDSAIIATPGTTSANGVSAGYGMLGGDQPGNEKDDSSDTILLRYQCNICENLQLPGFFNYMVHLRRDHNKCELCLETLKTQKDLEHHMKKHKLNHFCWKCGATYCAKQNFMTHLFWKHGTESEDCSKCLKKKWPHIYHFCIPPTTFVCDTCGYYFTKPKSLIVHKRLHTGEKLRKCPKKDCLQKFVSKKLLAKHIENVHVNPPKVSEPDPIPAIEPPSANVANSDPSSIANETDSLPLPVQEDPRPKETFELDGSSSVNGKADENTEAAPPLESNNTDALSVENTEKSFAEGESLADEGDESKKIDPSKLEPSLEKSTEENTLAADTSESDALTASSQILEIAENLKNEASILTESQNLLKESDLQKQPFNIQEIKGPNLSEESDCNNSDEEESPNRRKKSSLNASSKQQDKIPTENNPTTGQNGDENIDDLSAKLSNGSNVPTTNVGLVAKDLDLSDDSSSSFGDAEDDEDDSQERLDRPHSRPVETQSLPNSLITKLDDDPAMDIDDAILEKAVSENFKKVPRLDLDSALLDDPEKLKQHEDALNFGSMSPLLPPLDDFNFNMLQIPTFEENSLPEHIIQENAIFTLANEHDYCIPSALKRTSPLPSSGMANRSYPHSNGRPSSSRSPSQKKLKVCKPSAKKSSPKKRRRSSSSSSSSSSSCSSCGSNCSCSSSSSSSSCSSSSSDSETESRKHNQSKSSKSKHDKHESKSKISHLVQPVKKPRKQVIPKAPKPPKLPKPPPKKRGPKPNPNKIKGEPKPKRKYKKGNGKVRGRPRLNRNAGDAVPLHNFIPESDLETEDSGSDEIFHKRQLTEVIGKEIPLVDEIWTMGNEKFLLQVVRGVKDYEELRPPPEAIKKEKVPKKLKTKNMSYSVKRIGQQPRLKVRNVPIKPLIVKRQVGSETTEDDDKTVFMYGHTPLIGSRPLQTSLETNSTSNVITISRGLPNAATAAPASALVLGKKRQFPSAGPLSSPVSKNMKQVSGESGSAASPKQTGAQGKLNNVSTKGEKLLKDSPISSASSSLSPSPTKKARGRAKKVVVAEVPDEKLYCICQSPHDTVSQMIGCDDKDCEYQWFHFECVDILIPPKGKWFCSDCREKRRKKYMKMSRKNDLESAPLVFTSGSIPNKESGSTSLQTQL